MSRTHQPSGGSADGRGDHQGNDPPGAIVTSPGSLPSTPLPAYPPSKAPNASPSPSPRILTIPTVAPKAVSTLPPTSSSTTTLISVVSDQPKPLLTLPPAVRASTTNTTVISTSDPGPIAGLALLGLLVLAIIGCLTYCARNKCRKRKKQVCASVRYDPSSPRIFTGQGSVVPIHESEVDSAIRSNISQVSASVRSNGVEAGCSPKAAGQNEPMHEATKEQEATSNCKSSDETREGDEEEGDRTFQIESHGIAVESVEMHELSSTKGQSEVIDEDGEEPNRQRVDSGDRDCSPNEIDLHAARSPIAIMHHHDPSLRSDRPLESLNGEEPRFEDQAPVVELVHLYEARNRTAARRYDDCTHGLGDTCGCLKRNHQSPQV